MVQCGYVNGPAARMEPIMNIKRPDTEKITALYERLPHKRDVPAKGKAGGGLWLDFGPEGGPQPSGPPLFVCQTGDKTMRLPFVILNGRDNRRKEGTEAFGMDFGIHLYRI